MNAAKVSKIYYVSTRIIISFSRTPLIFLHQSAYYRLITLLWSSAWLAFLCFHAGLSAEAGHKGPRDLFPVGLAALDLLRAVFLGDRLCCLVVRVSWLQIQRSRVRFPELPDFLRSSGSGTGSTHVSLVRIIEELLERTVAAPV
jgi:hypothetical protein